MPALAACWALAILPAAGLAGLPLVVPADVVLPAVSAVAVVAAAVVALAAAAMPASVKPGAVTAWDIAGALALMGCAAAILGEIEPLLEYLRPMPERSRTRG